MFPKWPYAQVELALQQVNAHVAGTRVEMTKRLRESSSLSHAVTCYA